jgi:hypothetical protein
MHAHDAINIPIIIQTFGSSIITVVHNENLLALVLVSSLLPRQYIFVGLAIEQCILLGLGETNN